MNVPAPAPPLPLRLTSQAQRLSSELLQNVFIHNSVQERAIFSRSCKHWREAVIGHELFWRFLEIPKGKDLKVFMLEYFTKFSKSSLTSVIINAKVAEEDLDGILEILEESWGSLSELHITQHPSLNSRTRTFARNNLLSLQILSTTSLGYRGGKGSEKQFYLETYIAGLKQSFSEIILAKSSPTYLRFYTDDLKETETIDYTWMGTVAVLQVGSADSLENFHQILETIKYSLTFLDIAFYDVDHQHQETNHSLELSYLMSLHAPLIASPSFLSKWSLPAPFDICGRPRNVAYLSQTNLLQVCALLLELGMGEMAWDEDYGEEVVSELVMMQAQEVYAC